MTTTINEAKEITLLDGTILNIRPLKLSLLRDFMKKFEVIATVAEDNDKSIDAMLDCVRVALKQYKPELLATDINLEEILDLPLVNKIIQEASGFEMPDANLLNNL